jgi:hypothetical protein
LPWKIIRRKPQSHPSSWASIQISIQFYRKLLIHAKLFAE